MNNSITKEYLEFAIKLVEELKEPYQSQSKKAARIAYLIGYLQGGVKVCQLIRDQKPMMVMP